MKPSTTPLLSFAALLGATIVANADMNADTLLRTYDTGTPGEKRVIEQMVLTAENAFREANAVIVLQRNELALFCMPSSARDLTAKRLIEMVRNEVHREDFVGKNPFEMSMLHALQVAFPCPLQSK